MPRWNNYLDTLAYGNGDSVQYTYDEKARVTKQTYEDGDTVTYTYDNSGALATVKDSATGRTTTYYYDFTDRLMKYVESGMGFKHSVGYEYDDINNLTALVETINGVEHTTSYAYDDDNRVTSVTKGDATLTNTYDAFGRLASQLTTYGINEHTQEPDPVMEDSYTYTTSDDGTASGQVKNHTISLNTRIISYNYTYDTNGNIIAIEETTNLGRNISTGVTYAYDSANQLIMEYNQAAGKEWEWTYDDAGNILSRTETDYTTEEPTVTTTVYSYGDSAWGDLLTAYNGQTITYDTIGNPLSDGTWTYTWQHGRQLASMYSDNDTADDTSDDVTWSYTYNADGLRTKRTDGTTTYEYVYNGSQLSQMTAGSDTLYFSYDAGGTPMTVTYNGTLYHYVTNIQGDVIGVLNSGGGVVAVYSYDAWGNLLTVDGPMADTLGTLNPLRYRGYVYDQETELYYLQSRYYRPEWGRFINADNQLSTGNDLTGLNLFAYCGNNPVNRIDPSGEAWWHWAVAVAVVAVAAVAVVVTAGGAAAAVAAVTCVASGVAATSTAATVAAGVFIGSGTALGVSAIAASCNSNSVDDFANQGASALAATVTGGIVGGVTGYSMSKSQSTQNTQNTQTAQDSVCFVAGTLVKAKDGNIPIEEITVGDYVWAWDEKTGDVALKEVVETYVNQSDELIHVFANGEEIITTPEHPFYSPVKGWTSAINLRAGDILTLVNGEYVVVEKIQHEILESPITVYNFQVADYHTYFVSYCGVLVHNTCSNSGYTTPSGGGGISDSIQVGDITVTFGHGGRHLEGSALSISQVNPIIANDIVGRNLNVGQYIPNGIVNVGGINILYTAKRLTEFWINVGTYYIM